MATTNRVFIVIAFIFSAIGAIFNLVSLATDQWITGQATPLNGSVDINYAHYGLFLGNYKRNFPFMSIYELTMTCSFKNNICAMLCALDQEARLDLLEALYDNKIDASYSMNDCPTVVKYSYTYKSFESLTPSVRATSESHISKKHFINAGIWLSTLIFVLLALVTGSVAATLALYNSVANPIQYILSVKSLFIYNALAFFWTVVYMALWGTMYIVTIFHNMAIYDTIVESISSDKTAYLGYSYWIGFISMTFYVGSIGILYYREQLNAKDPKNKMISLEQDAADPGLYLY